MEATPPRGPVGGAEVPDAEKPSVPLNSLKMMFETGENLANKASPPPWLMGVSQRSVEGTSASFSSIGRVHITPGLRFLGPGGHTRHSSMSSGRSEIGPGFTFTFRTLDETTASPAEECSSQERPPWSTCSQWPLLQWSEPTSAAFWSGLVFSSRTGLHFSAGSSSVVLLALLHRPAQQESRDQSGGTRTESMEQLLADGSLAESTPLRDRMALYQAAISKQEGTPSSVNADLLDGFCGKQKENVPPSGLDSVRRGRPSGTCVTRAGEAAG
ncbi:unnamed protein product [Tetraodon nigroviridis]|uniref:Chromosome undetermined SCAF7283, whole genome shotgun sequence n=1 Tax=Tetraodon nigroviridis TaxID=99883 RepID=Q4TAM2_TETNG|nr:unnamed protein product [Tetraodon nigroviridis]